MNALPLTLACRAGPLAQALSAPSGVALTVLTPPVEALFGRMLREQAYDVAEMSLSSYVSTLARPDRPFIALPFFPLRRPVHSCLYVSRRSGIDDPRSLAGRRLAAPDYAMTAAVWMRGILCDEHGVDCAAVEHWIGGLEQPRSTAPPALQPAASWSVRRLEDHQTLATQLADGAIDALISPVPPSTLASRPSDVARLFDTDAEQAHRRRTGLHPAMHVMVMRREMAEAHPGLAASVHRALISARRRSDGAAAAHGDADGLEPNRAALATFLRHHHEQGLTPAGLVVDDLFACETRAL
jgi:4,5-dihydroxyphthalate decarboxylase